MQNNPEQAKHAQQRAKKWIVIFLVIFVIAWLSILARIFWNFLASLL